jgi:hypothetical protein
MTDLSPAAQTVLKAACIHHGLFNEEIVQRRRMVAAALRAAADLLSKEVDAPKVDGMKYTGLWHSHDYLNAIAAELESQ